MRQNFSTPPNGVSLLEGRLAPHVREAFPCDIPHPLPAPVAIDLDGNIDPRPRVRLGVACEVQPTIMTSEPQLLEVRIELRGAEDPHRAAWLAEIAALVTEWLESSPCLRFYTVPFRDEVFSTRIIRHALIGVQSLQGDPLWAHASAVRAGLVPFDCPVSQRFRLLAEAIVRPSQGALTLQRLDPSTGLPMWHRALHDELKPFGLPPMARGQRVLEQRTMALVGLGRHQDQDAALKAVQSEMEEALKGILGFKGLTWPWEAGLGWRAGGDPRTGSGS